MKGNRVYLTLQNGKVFAGYRFGADGETVGELVFATGGVTGYVETLTDPSYFGQIVAHTFPLIGNYGVMRADEKSDKAHLCAYVVREWCETPSNFRMEGDLDTYMKEKGVIGVYGIDTRELTKIVRENGVMNAAITSEPLSDPSVLDRYAIKDAVQKTTATEVSVLGDEKAEHTVVLYHFGSVGSIAEELQKRGCKVVTVPAHTSAEEALSYQPDGIVLSDGPGDPAENAAIVEEIKKLVGKAPMLGVSLGHQLFALAVGATTRKMKHGHRGAQPVKWIEKGRVLITSQNHGYEVVTETLPEGALVTFTNTNDGSLAGGDYEAYQATTVQFIPVTCGGPHDCGFLFDRFADTMRKEK